MKFHQGIFVRNMMVFSAKNHMEHDDKSTGLWGTLRRREKSKNVNLRAQAWGYPTIHWEKAWQFPPTTNQIMISHH
jgi:hypothetical protein